MKRRKPRAATNVFLWRSKRKREARVRSSDESTSTRDLKCESQLARGSVQICISAVEVNDFRGSATSFLASMFAPQPASCSTIFLTTRNGKKGPYLPCPRVFVQ